MRSPSDPGSILPEPRATMSPQKRSGWFLLGVAMPICTLNADGAPPAISEEKLPFTFADSMRVVRFTGMEDAFFVRPFLYSSDWERFLVTLRRCNLETWQNEQELRLYE